MNQKTKNLKKKGPISMKKFITVFLALTMVFAMSTFAFAAENTTLTINGAAGREYEGYKLLNLTTSLKADHVAHEGECGDSCYNYSYTVNEKYLEILQAEVFANMEEKPESAADVTEDDILEYLAAQTSDTDGTYNSMRDVADRLYKAIKAEGIEADEKDLTGNNDSIAQGYWMFADVTNLTGNNEANSLVMVDTKGQDSLVINPKTGLPTVEKKLKDINDSESADYTDWQDSADFDIGDKVPFKLTATLAENVGYYTTYKVVFHDELSAGLTLDTSSIEVYMYANKDDAANDENGTDVTDKFTSAFEDLDDACTFEVGCNNVLAMDNVDKNTVFVVYYEAELNSEATLGSAGNPNEVYLEFSNNPYGDGTGETEKDKVIVFTYQLTVNKTDSEGNALQGAGFTLYKKINGAYEIVGTEQVGGTMTTFIWKGLDDGEYKLVESKVPDGYNKMEDIEFAISAEHDEESADPALTSLTAGTLATGAVDTGIIEKDIENKTGTVLPETGAAGTMGLILGGSALVILAVVFMITRKKMSVYED
jgi:fimbrial isopeptide formation D2 family protein/LPXTG-motif cell wall-anchored protein